MIFVTVGTTHFDTLIRCVDQLAAAGVFPEPVLCQIGSGEYEPRHCEFFRFRPNIDALLEQASLVITHGGATVFALLAARTRFVAVANTALADNHQAVLLGFLARQVPLAWTDDLAHLHGLVVAALADGAVEIALPNLAGDFERFISGLA